MDADEILNRIRATTWDDEHDRETFSMSRPAALELLRTRLSPEPKGALIGRLQDWCNTYGKSLCPPGPDTFGEGMREAKKQVAAILALSPEPAAEIELPDIGDTQSRQSDKIDLGTPEPGQMYRVVANIEGNCPKCGEPFCAPVGADLEPEPAAPDAGVEETVEKIRSLVLLGDAHRPGIEAILTAHTASLRRERDEARKMLEESERLLADKSIALINQDRHHRKAVDTATDYIEKAGVLRGELTIAAAERDAARTDLAAAVRLLERLVAALRDCEGDPAFTPASTLALFADTDKFLAARQEAPK